MHGNAISYHILPIKHSQIVFLETEEHRNKLCKTPFKDNPRGCPNYNSNWSCPPHSPKMTATRKKLESYKQIFIVYSQAKISPAYNINNIEENYMKYHKLSSSIHNYLSLMKQKYPQVLCLYTSHCDYCEVCNCPIEPCRSPQNQRYSSESLGIDVFTSMKKIGVILEEKITHYIRRVGMLCSNDPVDFPEEMRQFFDGDC